MARTKANSTASTEKITEVEATEKVTNDVVETTEVENEVVEETTEEKTEKKAKKYKDDEKVKVKSIHCFGRSIIGLDANNPIQFDEKGVAETTGKEANRLLTIPGFSIA